MRRTIAYCWKCLHPLVNVFFFPAFVECLQVTVNKSSAEPSFAAIQTLLAICLKSGYVSHPFARFTAIIQVR